MSRKPSESESESPRESGAESAVSEAEAEDLEADDPEVAAEDLEADDPEVAAEDLEADDLEAEGEDLEAEDLEGEDLEASEDEVDDLAAGEVEAADEDGVGPPSPAGPGQPDLAPPPNAFLKGAVTGLILLIPLTALAVYVLGLLDIGDPQASYYSIVAFVAVFAGLPAIITAGGIGRAAASALVRPHRGGPSASTRVSAVYTAITTIGLVLLTVVPLGEVPTEVATWLWMALLGGVTGALGGFVLGLWVGYGSRKP